MADVPDAIAEHTRAAIMTIPCAETVAIATMLTTESDIEMGLAMQKITSISFTGAPEHARQAASNFHQQLAQLGFCGLHKYEKTENGKTITTIDFYTPEEEKLKIAVDAAKHIIDAMPGVLGEMTQKAVEGAGSAVMNWIKKFTQSSS